MSRISARFVQLKQQRRKALIPYFTAGDPHPDITVDLMHTVVAAGADLLELGVPFSDPMAEGPVIQLACERALQHNVSLNDVIKMVSKFRQRDSDTPVILMGYLNPIEVMGYATFAQKATEAGVDGVLIVDMPPEEAKGEPIEEFRSASLDLITLAAPTSDQERLQKIATVCSGFVYYVSLKGVTGAQSLNVESVKRQLVAVRKYVPGLPVGVGFGIKDAKAAAQVSTVADAVVVGSAVVQRIADNKDDPAAIKSAVSQLLTEMRAAMNAVEQQIEE